MIFDNVNRGVLFKNDRKISGDDPKLPDYTGSVNFDGRELWLNAWIKTSKTGSKYMSLSLKPKEAAKLVQRQATRQEDKIPW
jgi:uncharacterized protein (DUF736 family)